MRSHRQYTCLFSIWQCFFYDFESHQYCVLVSNVWFCVFLFVLCVVFVLCYSNNFYVFCFLLFPPPFLRIHKYRWTKVKNTQMQNKRIVLWISGAVSSSSTLLPQLFPPHTKPQQSACVHCTLQTARSTPHCTIRCHAMQCQCTLHEVKKSKHLALDTAAQSKLASAGRPNSQNHNSQSVRCST